MKKDFDYPNISNKLIECLDRDLPDKLPRAYVDNYEPGILIGQQQVIDRKMLFRLINLDKYQDLLYYKSCRVKDSSFQKGT